MPDLISIVRFTCEFAPDAQGCELAKSNLSSFAGWLARHATAVQELHLVLRCTKHLQMALAEGQELLVQLQRCEAACAAAGALRTLSVCCQANARMRLRPPPPGEPRVELSAGFSCTSLSSLQQLTISGQLCGRADLRALSALQRLSVRQAAPRIAPSDLETLPKSLTALDIGFADWMAVEPKSAFTRRVRLASAVRRQRRGA